MKVYRLQKRLASEIEGVSSKKVKFDAGKMEKIGEAITRADIRALINGGAIKILKDKGVSRGRGRKLHIQKVKGRRKGKGSRKGTKNARTPKKEVWMSKIRVQRELLSNLRGKGVLTPSNYRKLYLMAKGGFFRSKAHLKLFITKMAGEKR